jgi:ATP-dependent Clp protease ATP-binding subunit ClpX
VQKEISKRLNTQVIGYIQNANEIVDTENLLQYITHKDLKSFGLIPELIGRLPVLTYLEPLDKETLMSILVEPKNAIVKQYARLFELEGIKLKFDNEALEFIAEKALEYKLGARGLRSLCEAILKDAMFELPSIEGVSEFNVDYKLAHEKITKSKLSKLVAA